MLKNPFRTTREMKVPMRNRVGNRERSFRAFAILMVNVFKWLLFLYFLLQVLSLYAKG